MSESGNPLLASLKLPGRIFQLPSRGIFYKNGELDPDIKNGEIHVRPMSALDEIIMKNPDQLFSGDGIDTVFKHCVSGIAKPRELLSKDVDAITMFLRVVTYGQSYEFMARHICEDAKDHSYVADVEQLISNMPLIDPTTVEDLFSLTVANGQKISIKPNRYQHMLDLIKANESKTSPTAADTQANLMSMLLGVIESIDEIKDPKLITEWVKLAPVSYINRLGEKINATSDWGPNLKWTCECKDCKQNFEIELPINPVSFFTE
jgi:hypothetical protein